MDFLHIEPEYRRLKAKFDAGQLTEADFKALLQNLMLQDEQGRWWMIGYETGQWYVHDGEKWVPAQPPCPPSPAEPPVAMPDQTETVATHTKLAQARAEIAPVAAATTPSAPPKTRKLLLLVGLAAVVVSVVAIGFGMRGSGLMRKVVSPVLPATSVPAPELTPAQAAPAAAASIGASAEGATAEGLTCLADAYNGKAKGAVVTMSGPFTDHEAIIFNESIRGFEEATGIDIQYEGTNEFVASITVRMQAGDAPDIVDFPQPGLLNTFVGQGKIIPVTDMVPEAWLAKNFIQSWRDMATMAGADGKAQEYGVWQRFNGKSLVWYPKKAFDAAGYTVPSTWEELLALTKQITAAGDTPWCIGIESGWATGWPATDWTEEMMLRTTSLQNYDKWVKGELKFASSEVRKAIETFAAIWNNDKYVYGGTPAIVTTFFGDSPTPMFEDPPKCWLHKQGNWITSFFPEGVTYGEDYGVFYLPGIDPQYGKPFLVAGDIMAATENRPETCAVMQYFSTGEGVRGWLAAGGALGPQKDAQLEWYGSDLERDIAGLVNGATAFRFDASDLMPGEVGAGSFWQGMTDYFSGAVDLNTVLKTIDSTWPR